MKAKIETGDKNNPNLKSFSVNGVMQQCPYKTTFIIPGQLTGQQPSIMQQSCANSCPHCLIEKSEIKISCGGTPVLFQVEPDLFNELDKLFQITPQA